MKFWDILVERLIFSGDYNRFFYLYHQKILDYNVLFRHISSLSADLSTQMFSKSKPKWWLISVIFSRLRTIISIIILTSPDIAYVSHCVVHKGF